MIKNPMVKHSKEILGILPIKSIERIVAMPASRTELMFKVQERDFHLRAPTEELRT